MCCLFGLLDYKNCFQGRDKSKIISTLAKESEERGTDATGVAYVGENRLRIYKRPLPAHCMKFLIPSNTKYIMGHTRMATQGDEKRNYNNHPWLSTVDSNHFALCHNGVIYNDSVLRKKEKLPKTKIKTDSYIAVQLIEHQKSLNFNSIKNMAEKVEGSFCFTMIDEHNNFYFVKGSNPLCIYHFKNLGFYIYASTQAILERTILKLGLEKFDFENVSIDCGEILKVNNIGEITKSYFEFDEWENCKYLCSYSYQLYPCGQALYETHVDDAEKE